MKEKTNQPDTEKQNAEKQEIIELPSDKKRGVKMLTFLLIAVVVITSVSIAIANIMKYNQLLGEKEKLEKENERLEQEIDRLQYLVDSPINYDYIVREAHNMGMYFPDEKIGYTDGD